jgi:hypothetical protein
MNWANDLKDAAPGVLGSAVALFFMKRPYLILVGMFIGGCVLSYYAPIVFVDYYHVEKYIGLVGFLTGLFGMAAVAKVYDGLEQVNLGDLWGIVKSWLRKRAGLSEGNDR